MATPEKGSEAPPAEQRDDNLSDGSPPAGRVRRTFRARLAELLEAVAAMVVELDRGKPVVEERALELRGAESSIAVSHQRESSVAQHAHTAAILLSEQDREPAKSERNIIGGVGAMSVTEPQQFSDDTWMDALCSDNSELSETQRRELRALLREFDIGRTTILSHHINTGNAAPIRPNPYRLCPTEKDHVRLAVDEMLAVYIISPSNSP
ncbi:unnamed protein product [Lampetra planeri]